MSTVTSPFMCVRRDLVTESTFFEGWVDQFSGSRESDLNVYPVHNPMRTSVVRLGYYHVGHMPKPSGVYAHCLAHHCVSTSELSLTLRVCQLTDLLLHPWTLARAYLEE